MIINWSKSFRSSSSLANPSNYQHMLNAILRLGCIEDIPEELGSKIYRMIMIHGSWQRDKVLIFLICGSAGVEFESSPIQLLARVTYETGRGTCPNGIIPWILLARIHGAGLSWEAIEISNCPDFEIISLYKVVPYMHLSWALPQPQWVCVTLSLPSWP